MSNITVGTSDLVVVSNGIAATTSLVVAAVFGKRHAGLRNLNIAGAIIAKMKYNQTRPYRHGGKRF